MRDAQARLEAVIAAIPYARFLGMRMELAGDEMTAILPYREALVGIAVAPALHGGVIGAFLEMTALAQLSILHPAPHPEPRLGDASPSLARQPRPIGVTVEYLRSGRLVQTYARAQVRRAGRRLANVSVEAWQDRRATPIALLAGRFLLPGDGSHPVQAPGEKE